MKKLLIVETEYVGHYLTGYIKYILRALNKKNIQIYLLTSKDAIKRGKGALEILKKEKVNFYIKTIPNVTVLQKNFISLTIYQLKQYFLIKKKFNVLDDHIKFDHVILTSIQRIDKVISILGSPFGSTKFSGIFLGLKFHLNKFKIKSSSTNHFLSRFLFYKLLKIKTLTKILTNDYLLKNYLKDEKWFNNKKVMFLHDPKEFNFTYSRTAALKKLNINSNKYIILVYGAIINSKGIEELLNIYKHDSDNIHCLIVGKQFDDVRRYLKNNPFVKNLKKKNVISTYDEWQDEEKESIFFSAADVIWVGYKNYSFPSGVMYQAACLNKPTILSKEAGFINNLNKKYRIGISCNVNEPLEILNAIKKIKNNKYKLILKKNISQFYQISKPSIWTKKFQNYILNII